MNNSGEVFPLLLTKPQINRINKSFVDKTGVDINISKKQISAQSKNGRFLGALASFLARTVLPTVARIAPKVVAPLATGAFSGLTSTGVSTILGNGITINKATRYNQPHRTILNQCPN